MATPACGIVGGSARPRDLDSCDRRALVGYHFRQVSIESEELAEIYLLAKRAGESSELATAIARRPMTDDENELLEALERFAAKHGTEPSVGGAILVLLQALDTARTSAKAAGDGAADASDASDAPTG